jgi:hypothetical protein
MQFHNRTEELKDLREILEREEFQFIILYGRRRVGKTELILQATKQKNRVYYLAVGQDNLRRLYETCSLQYPEVSKLRQTYDVIFDFLKNNVEVIIIDEFQNMIQEDENILHLMQSIIDVQLKDTKMKLFLIGSSVSLMTSKILNYTSPLYGRRTGSIKLEAIDFYDFTHFFPDLGLKEQIEIYSFSDGIPYYINNIEPPLWEWMEKELKKSSSIFRDEIDFLMRYEFSRPGMYKSILEAIAFGKTTLSDIKGFVGIKRTDISPYLSNLIDVDMIVREIPITEKPNSRRGRYYLKDNYLKFWFRFIYPNLSAIEEGIFDINIIRENYSTFLGSIFEKVVKQFLIRSDLIKITKIGRWWWKDKEIDLIAFNQFKNSISFIECKWQKKVNAKRISLDLIKKKEYVDWNSQNRNEHFIIFARSFYQKITEYKGIKVTCIDLQDMAKIFKDKEL